MSDNNFSVIFDGDEIPDHELFGVKQRLKDIFKADRARVESLFAGKPVALKRNLSREDAIKYQHMLKKAGVNVTVLQAGHSLSTEKAGASQNIQTENPLFSLAPLGSDLLGEEKHQDKKHPSLFRTDHLDLAPQEGNILKPNERQPVQTAKIKGEYSDWDLSEMGEDLLKKSEKHIWEAADIDTSALAFVSNKEPLTPPTKVVNTLIKTDHLQLASIEKSDTTH